MNNHWALILIEGVLVLGGVLVFAWWQLGSMAREQREQRARRENSRSAEEERAYRLHDEAPPR